MFTRELIRISFAVHKSVKGRFLWLLFTFNLQTELKFLFAVEGRIQTFRVMIKQLDSEHDDTGDK